MLLLGQQRLQIEEIGASPDLAIVGSDDMQVEAGLSGKDEVFSDDAEGASERINGLRGEL